MVLAIDVHYREGLAKAVGVLFQYADEQPSEIILSYTNGIDEDVPGEFYKRELPCLLNVIEKTNKVDIDIIIIDGYVYLDNNFKQGLGAILWEKLNQKIPVIGVAKTPFFSNKETVIEVFRGESKKPLYISSIGINLEEVAEKIKNMKGEYRIPTILKQLDIITKED